MLGYYLRLAFKSFARTPGLTVLMVCAIASGIGACIVTLTVYRAMSGNPIWWKNDVLFAVTMDSWGPNAPADPANPELPPPQLTYRDATYLYGSRIPERKAIMTVVGGMLSGTPGQSVPLMATTRATTADFFSMFDVPFEYGGGWSERADRGPDPVIVLSRAENERLFGGIDSVGRTILWNGHRFRIVGVIGRWRPIPRFYDITPGGGGVFGTPDEVFVPFQWAPTLKEIPASRGCWGPEQIRTYQEFLTSNCAWINMWVELPTLASRARMLAFINSYWAAQRRMGRFQRPLNNHLTDVSDWLRINHVVNSDSRILLRLAFVFLAVCLINSIGILLAKFLKRAGITGVRRALGASRRQIFLQHLVEVAVIAVAGAALGLAMGAAGLAALHAFYGGSAYGRLAQFEPAGIVWALGLATLSTLAAGLYPAWSIGRLPPSRYLAGQ